MVIGYTLINTKAGCDKDVFDKMLKVPYVREVSYTDSPYKIIAKLDAPSISELGMTNWKRIREMDGVTDSMLIIALLHQEVEQPKSS